MALLALNKVYGKNIVSEGPVYLSHKVVKNGIEVTFKNGEGLVALAKELDVDGSVKTENKIVSGFTICGEDKVFYNATATIKKNTVIVSCKEVASPVAVRYAWANFPAANLYNKAGLPAAPFRTDDFPYPVK